MCDELPEPAFTFAPPLDKEPVQVVPGLVLREVTFGPLRAHGRAVCFRPGDFDLGIHVFSELVNKNFNPARGYSPPPDVNLGTNIPQFLDGANPEAARGLSRVDINRCVFACNTLHTNFVRGNGFVVIENGLVCKPPGAAALDGDHYIALAHDYQTIIFDPPPLEVTQVSVERNKLAARRPIRFAISGPALVVAGRNAACSIPARMKADGQTINDEINCKLRSSFTAFGIEGNSDRVIVVSVFAGKPGAVDRDTTFYVQNPKSPNEGITLNEMARLLIALGASDAIAGGGAGDTQQYVYRRGILAGQPRHQPDRSQVHGLRGLGAILSLSVKQSPAGTSYRPYAP
ncbi:MAG: phosphodiester glycosidase family protein [Methylococcales bacterium]|nr:phosphodiester glycosidase family protein [Methylococcales bacterium]